jgi:selenocysteine-specific elongation factor
MSAPLTVGTAGHVDHGKTELVRALTGVDTDRLPEEKDRGLTIVLGYARLRLPSGRELSLIDVPGHERLIRTMVAGATGIDLFLLAVAADDGVMPQTVEHVRVLEALGVSRGVVAITKSDLADPGEAAGDVARLLPGTEVVPCSARRGDGIDALATALQRSAATTPGRGLAQGPVALHIDRVFTITGAGTVVTGTLWSGVIRPGDRLTLLPGGRVVRVRAVHVHDDPVLAAGAGQRVAVNLTGIERTAVAPGEALVGPGSAIRATYRVQAQLRLHAHLGDGARVHVHHGTRHSPARARRHPAGWQLRLERPLLAAPGDRIVVRAMNPPLTMGGGIIVGLGAPAGAVASTPRSRAGDRSRPSPQSPWTAAAPPLSPSALCLEDRLREAGLTPPTAAELGEATAGDLAELREAGRVVRVGRAMHAHRDAVAAVRTLVEEIIVREGSISLVRLRDELGTSRRYAHAFLEHLDGARITRRRDDDSRVLRGLG